MADLLVNIVTPERSAFSGPASEIIVPGALGEFGVLPGHTLFLSLSRPGVVTVRAAQGDKRFVIGRGFVEATGEKVTVLADSCEDAASVDKAAAAAALAAAEPVLLGSDPSSEAWLRADQQAELARARLSA